MRPMEALTSPVAKAAASVAEKGPPIGPRVEAATLAASPPVSPERERTSPRGHERLPRA